MKQIFFVLTFNSSFFFIKLNRKRDEKNSKKRFKNLLIRIGANLSTKIDLYVVNWECPD